MSRRDIASFVRVIDRVDRARDGEADPRAIATGFPSLDRAISGGFRRGDLVVVGGDTGAGTSSLALAIAMRQQSPTLVLTAELHPDRVYERALAGSARISLEAMRLGTLSDEERVRLAAVALRDHVPQVEALGRDGTDAVARAMLGAPRAKLVIVDGLESLVVRDHHRDEVLAFSLLTLKHMALERDAVLLVLTHLPNLDRSRQDKRPRLVDFGVCDAVGVHADVVLGLFREEMYDPGLGVAGAAELVLLKHRDGALGYVDLYCHAEWLRFEDVLDVED